MNHYVFTDAQTNKVICNGYLTETNFPFTDISNVSSLSYVQFGKNSSGVLITFDDDLDVDNNPTEYVVESRDNENGPRPTGKQYILNRNM